MSKIRPTEEQQAVIDAQLQDDILIIAGAGSGKTFTLKQRITRLIEQGVPPEHILGLTFTRKAAAQLIEKISDVINDSKQGGSLAMLRPTVMTYDAFFQSIVKRYGLLVGMPQEVVPLSDAGAHQIAADVLSEHVDQALTFYNKDGSHKSFSTLVQEILDLYSAIASSMIGGDIDTISEAIARIRQWDAAFDARLNQFGTAEDYEQTLKALLGKAPLVKKALSQILQMHANIAEREFLLDCVQEFDEAKRARGLAQFSDFTIAAYRLVHRFPSIGHTYRKLFSHVFLDEYQDTSTTQAQLLVGLFRASDEDRSAVTAVGDPFQSIYAWRGASPGAFQLFRQDFAMGEERPSYTLSQTMRNSQVVLEAANMVTVPLRRSMQVPSSASLHEVDVAQLRVKDEADIGTVGALNVSTQALQVQAVAKFARLAVEKHRERALKEKVAPVAILMRTKVQIPLYRQAVEEQGLSCGVVGVEGLLERPDVADMIAVLRALTFKDDPTPLMHVLASPRFALDTKALHTLSRLTSASNEQFQYAALIQAHVIEPGLKGSREIREALRPYRNMLAPAQTIVDMLLHPQFAILLREYVSNSNATLSEQAIQSLIAASNMMRSAERNMHRGLHEAMYGVFRALQLDIDPKVAASIRGEQNGNSVQTDTAQGNESALALQALLQLADNYVGEQPQGARATMSGLLSWIDTQRDVPGDLAPVIGQPDVVIMTIHQSKGLEWPAVIIPQLNEGAFPGGGNAATGDQLKVTAIDAEGTSDEYVVPEYEESAKTWLDRPTTVPPMIRVDHDILPHFPHNASNNADIDEQMAAITSIEQLWRECANGINIVDNSEHAEIAGVWRGQSAEYGKRFHDDDRRLMYVALTRSECDALVVCSTYPSDMTMVDASTVSGFVTGTGMKKNPSNFWNEVYGSLCNAKQFEQVHITEDFGNHITGIFVGESAQEYYQRVVVEPWEHPMELRDASTRETWPWHVEPSGTREALAVSAERVEQAMSASETAEQANPETIEPQKPQQAESSQLRAPARGTFTQAAQNLIDQGMLVPRTPLHHVVTLEQENNDTQVDSAQLSALKAQGQRIVASGRQSVTAVQQRMNIEHEPTQAQLAYWQGIVRPMPRINAYVARSGTDFHAWAQEFILPSALNSLLALDESGQWDPSLLAQWREPMIEELVQQLEEARHSHQTQRIRELTWRKRLVESPWAKRTPFQVERSVTVNINGQVYNGKLDVVFVGGLDEHSNAKYTIIDWKTGKRPTGLHIGDKLVQLDLYRLLLARTQGIDIAQIDAALYYVSEQQEENRLIVASGLREQEILARLAQL